MMASSRGRTRSSPRDGRGFGRIGCLLDQAEEHAIMNRAETEDGSYARARNRKLLAGLGLKPGENEYAEPDLNPCQTTAYAFFTGDQRVERKLAAIFVADVAGYSRLIHSNEVGTLRTLTAHREIMDGLIAEHRGRIVNTAGDSVLAEFPSAIDAVQCAVAVQDQLRAANESLEEARR